jgi:hypothetical protein
MRQIKQAGILPACRIPKDKILRGELLIRTHNFTSLFIWYQSIFLEKYITRESMMNKPMLPISNA